MGKSRVAGSYKYGTIRHIGKPSTRTRLHELAHKVMHHEPGLVTLGRFIGEEIDAERWAWKMMGKETTYRVGIPALCDLVQNYNFKPDEAVKVVVIELRDRNIPVSKQAVKELKGWV